MSFTLESITRGDLPGNKPAPVPEPVPEPETALTVPEPVPEPETALTVPEPVPEPEASVPAPSWTEFEAITLPAEELAPAAVDPPVEKKPGFALPPAPAETDTRAFQIPTATPAAPVYGFLGDEAADPGNFSHLFDPSRRPNGPSDSPAEEVPESEHAVAGIKKQKMEEVPAHPEQVVMNYGEGSEFDDAVVNIIGREFPTAPDPHMGLAAMGLLAFPPVGGYALSMAELSLRAAFNGETDTARKAAGTAKVAGISAIILGIVFWAVLFAGAYVFREDLIVFLRAML